MTDPTDKPRLAVVSCRTRIEMWTDVHPCETYVTQSDVDRPGMGV